MFALTEFYLILGSKDVKWGWCTGMTQRVGMGREEGGGFRMGTRVHPWCTPVDVW